MLPNRSPTVKLSRTSPGRLGNRMKSKRCTTEEPVLHLTTRPAGPDAKPDHWACPPVFYTQVTCRVAELQIVVFLRGRFGASSPRRRGSASARHLRPLDSRLRGNDGKLVVPSEARPLRLTRGKGRMCNGPCPRLVYKRQGITPRLW